MIILIVMPVKHQASFRDAAGYVFIKNQSLYRQINVSYLNHYEALINSGLYDELIAENLLIPHLEVENINADAYKTIKPEFIPFISYPYEWCFDQLKEAALNTLSIVQMSLKKGMILKDASAYNIQFHNNKAILIDTLSFEMYEQGQPWVAYRQFCQHFLSPLLLMCRVDESLVKLLFSNIDGIPLEVTAKILPFHERFKFPSLLHIFMHAKSIAKNKHKTMAEIEAMPKTKFNILHLISHLQSTIEGLKINRKKSQWSQYYLNSTDEAYLSEKEALVRGYLDKLGKQNIIWDAGGNNGAFSRLFASYGSTIICTDTDRNCLAENVSLNKKNQIKNIFPIFCDLANPSPALGLMNREHESFLMRMNADVTFAFALVHHLRITNQISFEGIAELFASSTKYLIIEWVGADDDKCAFLLGNNKLMSANYNETNFKDALEKYFIIHAKSALKCGLRTLYFCEKNNELK